MIKLDAALSNADWVKRTPDRLGDLKNAQAHGGSDKPQDELAAKETGSKSARRKRG
jgi:hypothetical protein